MNSEYDPERQAVAAMKLAAATHGATGSAGSASLKRG
jgi:hypothetical protein